ncbi:hypothetical protein IAQ61_005367 [Plenodomus lingam]|uniref:uncharacterized protein n=1 Tax=Leptosphaeria maculans TaxID=5022 RepID=UPI003323BB1F|nr:hypothetical protein IAQ61_005367 [Plenodomus lingam]
MSMLGLTAEDSHQTSAAKVHVVHVEGVLSHDGDIFFPLKLRSFPGRWPQISSVTVVTFQSDT